MVKRSREESNSHPYHESSEPLPPSRQPAEPTDDSPTEASLPTKIIHIDPSISQPTTAQVMQCSLPGHQPNLSLATFQEYEVHYQTAHTNRCTACSRNFPTPHYLSLHQTEHHDPFTAVLKDRGERIYGCLVEGCDRQCSSKQKRKMHCVDKHGFPREYEFRVVEGGIDGRTSLLREDKGGGGGSARRQNRAMFGGETKAHKARLLAAPSMAGRVTMMEDVEMGSGVHDTSIMKESTQLAAEKGSESSDADAMGVDQLAGAMSALRFIPPSVRSRRVKAHAASPSSKS